MAIDDGDTESPAHTVAQGSPGPEEEAATPPPPDLPPRMQDKDHTREEEAAKGTTAASVAIEANSAKLGSASFIPTTTLPSPELQHDTTDASMHQDKATPQESAMAGEAGRGVSLKNEDGEDAETYTVELKGTVVGRDEDEEKTKDTEL